MIEFRYTNLVPPAARPGTNTNVINLRWDGTNLTYGRRYVSQDGSLSESIEHTFDANSINDDTVAKQIHWGCCGWSAGGHEIWQLKNIVAKFLETRPTQ